MLALTEELAQRRTGGSKPPIVLESELSGTAVVGGRLVIMLGSNDYLGLSTHPQVLSGARRALDRYGAGTGMNPVVATTRVHGQLAEAMAEFTGCEDVLLLNSCTAANCALIGGLVEQQDSVVSDELNHASVIDGCRLSAGRTHVYRHRDVGALADALRRAGGSRLTLVVTDGVFSMEGVTAPLPEIAREVAKGDAVLAVDESHAAGVVGPTGRGTGEQHGALAGSFVQTGTFSKAFGAGIGGYVAGPRALIDHLRDRARFYVFTSGLPASAAGAALGALAVLMTDSGPLDRLRANAAYLRDGLEQRGLPVLGERGAILPVVLGAADRAHGLSAGLLERGIFAPSFAYPIVPRDAARLRLQVTAAHALDQLEAVLAAIDEIHTNRDH